MVQTRAGHKTQSITLGSKDSPANGSHFRNLKCLKIDEVVSQQQQKIIKRERKTIKGERREGREEEKKGKDMKPSRKC